ncbi:MFS general substrate transporter [Hypoxylon trugodes]|uniref:MFS general substrate transporter n=1 Tax=Hypoxylon trugodes TaxID=326681 RepID=UPI0021957A38|nr:MFS general substrate transporter [Hypoxylon trugodes]KAI1385699.1 MFS general substrate transporter [Hypoxylon trugodes]
MSESSKNINEKSSGLDGATVVESQPVQPDVDFDEVYSREEQRKIIRRVDNRLIPVLGSLYVNSLIDRVNISSAAIDGLDDDLQLQVGSRYSIVILIFFITYTLFQPLGTIVTRKFGPRWFLSSLCMTWGVCMIGNGFIKSWEGLVGLRVLMGILEAGYFPGAVYLMSTWYTRFDMQKRYVAMYGTGCLAGAFGGVMAYSLSQMEGIAGLRGWRWIFIIEGIISCIIALSAYVFLIGFPEDDEWSWKFLNRKEREFIIRRVNRDRGDAIIEPFSMRAFFGAATDWKIWVYAFMFFCVTTVGYSINYFLPIIFLGMGFNVALSQILVVPPWAFTFIFMYIQAWISDRYRLRAPIIAFNAILACIGLALMAFHPSPGVRFFGVFIVIAGGSGNIPPVLTYQANNIRGQWKRAFSSATQIGAGGIGGVAGALVFRSQDSPRYIPGIYASMACNICVLICAAGMSVHFWYANKKARRGLVILEGLEGFTYTL